MSNQVIQKVIQDIKGISGLNASVWNIRGECLAMTHVDAKKCSEKVEAFVKACENGEQTEYLEEGVGLFAVYTNELPECVLVLQGQDSAFGIIGKMGVSQLENLIQFQHEKNDKNRFIQNLILDNILPLDIYNQAKKMRIPYEKRRAVFVVEPKQEGENLISETMRGAFASGSGGYVTAVDEHHVILVKDLEDTDDYPDLYQLALTITDTLNTEAMVSVRVSYGTIVGELKEVSRSYKEASMALEVGRVFYSERGVLAYNELGIGRLIHQLPKSLCEMFLKEVLNGNASELFEDEELITVHAFFDNNLNISETARQLFIHRNTLVYRLEKIEKKTGLDVRVFEEALTFKIAVMVEKHLKSLNVQ